MSTGRTRKQLEFARIKENLFKRSLQTVMFDALDDVIARKPDRIAIYNDVNDLSDAVTFSELKELSLAIASFLHSKGMQTGANAAIVLPNCWQIVAIWIGALFQGMSITGVSPKFGKLDTKYKINGSYSSIVFTDLDNLGKVRLAKKEGGTVKCVVVIDAEEDELEDGEISFDQVIQTKFDRNRAFLPVDPENDTALILFSSGTTGQAKAILHTHRSLVAVLVNTDANMPTFWEAAFTRKFNWIEENQIALMSITHAMGFYQLMLFLRKGVSFVMMKNFNAADFCKAAQEFKVRFVVIQPCRIRELIKESKRFDVRSIEWLFVGGSLMSSALHADVRRHWPHVQRVHPAYGMSEIFAPFMKDLRNDEPLSAGRVPRGSAVKVIDEKGKVLPYGEIGELCVKTPTQMKGYGNNPEAMAKTVINGWLHTGDLGYVDNDGCVFVSGRRKVLMKVGDFTVFPFELEDTLMADTRVADAAVIGIPVSDDHSEGEIPKAFVVKADNNLNERDVCAIIADNLAVHKQLKGGVVFLNAIPKTPTGKVDYMLLKML